MISALPYICVDKLSACKRQPTVAGLVHTWREGSVDTRISRASNGCLGHKVTQTFKNRATSTCGLDSQHSLSQPNEDKSKLRRAG